MFVRAGHLLAASAVAGGYLLGVEIDLAHGWWIATGATGLLLLCAEFYQHRGLHREIAGWATLGKLLILGGAVALPAAGPWLVSAAFVVAVLGAHFPRKWRHHRVF